MASEKYLTIVIAIDKNKNQSEYFSTYIKTTQYSRKHGNKRNTFYQVPPKQNTTNTNWSKTHGPERKRVEHLRALSWVPYFLICRVLTITLAKVFQLFLQYKIMKQVHIEGCPETLHKDTSSKFQKFLLEQYTILLKQKVNKNKSNLRNKLQKGTLITKMG